MAFRVKTFAIEGKTVFFNRKFYTHNFLTHFFTQSRMSRQITCKKIHKLCIKKSKILCEQKFRVNK
mgnify:CR=1 FL=1